MSAEVLAGIEALLRSGQADKALAQCRALGKGQAKRPEVMRLEGFAHYLLGRHGDAVAALRRYCAERPRDVGALLFLGNAQQAGGKARDAVSTFRKALALEPGAAQILYNLGNALLEVKDPAGAEAAFAQAITSQPDYGKAWAGKAMAASAQERQDEAMALYGKALELDPTLHQALGNLGNLLRKAGRSTEAVDILTRAVSMKPDFAEAHSNLGNAFYDMGRYDQAISSHERAIALSPGQGAFHNNLGTALFRVGRVADACDAYQTAWSRGGGEAARRNLLAALLYRDDLDQAALDQVLRHLSPSSLPRIRPPAPSDPGQGPLRVGYLSSDLCSHPVASNMLPVLEAMDRNAFQSHFFVNLPRKDGVTERFQGLAASWHDITALDDAEAARLIRSEGIHILVSLAGRFDDNRPGICAHRAAPIQISLHDVATSGLGAMDYLVGDPVLLPRRGTEWMTERPLRLPRFYVARPPDPLPPLRPSRRASGPVFGCFNNPSKIGSAVLTVWGRILAARPEARLVLKYRERYACPALSSRVLAGLTAAGALPEQVEMPLAGEDAAFLDRYNDVDVALDTFPFSGSTTTFQALSMGVPVVTWPWPRMVGRWTESMLFGLGLEELVVRDADDYVGRALEVADPRLGWRGRRPHIRARLLESGLCRGDRWARHYQRLLRAVWHRALAKTGRN